jgi:hypothetical protein
METWKIYEQLRQINEYLSSKGYDKKMSIYPDRHNQHFQICLVDICGNYHYIEYGSYTRDKAYLMLNAFYAGIGLGSLDFIVSI